MKTYYVIVERSNGHFRALFPALPNIAAEGATRDEAIAAATAAAQQYLREVEITTVHLAEPQPIANEVLKQEAPQAKLEARLSVVEEQYLLAAAWMRSAGLSPQDPDDPSYQEYLAILATQKQQQRESREGAACGYQ